MTNHWRKSILEACPSGEDSSSYLISYSNTGGGPYHRDPLEGEWNRDVFDLGNCGLENLLRLKSLSWGVLNDETEVSLIVGCGEHMGRCYGFRIPPCNSGQEMVIVSVDQHSRDNQDPVLVSVDSSVFLPDQSFPFVDMPPPPPEGMERWECPRLAPVPIAWVATLMAGPMTAHQALQKFGDTCSLTPSLIYLPSLEIRD